MSTLSGTTHAQVRQKIPVAYWAAGIGALLLIFEIYLLVKWITGPYFVPVPYGPSELPGWMKLSIDIYEPLSIVGTLFGMWLIVGRPWVREKRVTVWGLLLIALLLTSIYDPASCYFRNWFGYNAYFTNYGSPLPGGVPGWSSFHEPGAMIAWPIIFMPTLYPFIMLFPAWMCLKSMQWFRARYPRSRWTSVVAFCMVVAMVMDILLEGELFMRLGWYAEAGWAMNQGEYYQLPYRNIFFVVLMFTALASLLYFRNDQGQTFVERGIERLERNSLRQIVVRFLALLAAIQLIMIVLYHIPAAIHEKYFPSHWPDVIASKSYWNGHMCGPQTSRPCPNRPGHP